MEQTSTRIVVVAAGYQIEGDITLPREGYRSRITDYLNAADRDFIALTDVVLQPLGDTSTSLRRPFVALSRTQILLAMPADETAAG